MLKRACPPTTESHMLVWLTREHHRRYIFPAGRLRKSPEVLALAQAGIPVADKPDSMEICFIPDGELAPPGLGEARVFHTEEACG